MSLASILSRYTDSAASGKESLGICVRARAHVCVYKREGVCVRKRVCEKEGVCVRGEYVCMREGEGVCVLTCWKLLLTQ